MLAKKLGMRTSIGSIGTMMCREDFARRALPHLDEALFSLHGPNASVHDALTRRDGSFDRVVKAMETVKRIKPDFGLFVNTVLTQHNVDALPETVCLASSLGAQLVVVSNLTPEGGGDSRYMELTPSLEQLAVSLPAAAEALQNTDTVLRFFGVPMCILGPHRMLSNDLHWDPRVTVEWTSQPGKVVLDGIYSWAPDRKRVHVDACSACTLRGVCTGVFDQYAQRYPTTALRAVSGNG
jgi:MoaA/NifB/PqqE/SkfB family radical SAM enzyme